MGEELKENMSIAPDNIWCEEGGRMLRLTVCDKGLIIETINVTNGWPGEVVDKVTIARFRLHRIKMMIDEVKGG